MVFTAKSGDIVMVDTVNCFHCGSRTRGKRRATLLFTYNLPIRSALGKTQSFSAYTSDNLSEYQAAVLS